MRGLRVERGKPPPKSRESAVAGEFLQTAVAVGQFCGQARAEMVYGPFSPCEPAAHPLGLHFQSAIPSCHRFAFVPCSSLFSFPVSARCPPRGRERCRRAGWRLSMARSRATRRWSPVCGRAWRRSGSTRPATRSRRWRLGRRRTPATRRSMWCRMPRPVRCGSAGRRSMAPRCATRRWRGDWPGSAAR